MMRWLMDGALSALRERSLVTKIAIIAATDFLMLSLVVLISYALRVSRLDIPDLSALHLYLVAPIISVALAFGFGVYNSSARNHSSDLERRVAVSQLFVPAVWAIYLLLNGTSGFARSTLLIYLVISILSMVLLRRIAARLLVASSAKTKTQKERLPVIIYGAGREGIDVLEALRRHGRYRPVAFIDTDYTLVSRMISGLKVYSTEQLDEVLKKYAPQEVIIAKPLVGRANKKMLVDKLVSCGLLVKTVPALDEIVKGKINFSDIQTVRIEDLLGRDPVPPDRKLMEKMITAKVVLVTGAGGSIGSEIARQSVAFNPEKIILLDSSEFALFEIHRELEGSSTIGQTKLVPILADVRVKKDILEVIRKHEVDIVFHAAAYKHVRMVQENVAAGIENNVFGTLATATAATEAGVKNFILISTDKAVRPTSVMGATKRVAEMIVQALASEKNHSTILSIVRFGNVLGSTGSVVPLFREQIAKGGPLTVTHPDVTRYFMLISEASQLVIQSSAMAEGGEVFVLDMGEPIKILTLAETMIELAGLTVKNADNPNGDIEVAIVGLKDGEKLYEELQIGNDVTLTQHPRILKCRETFLPPKQLKQQLKGLEDERNDVEGAKKVRDLITIA